MAKQVRKPASTGKIGPQSVSTDRNKIKGTSKPATNHPKQSASNTYKPTMLRPTKRG